jgi:hypothetical protein
MLPVLFISGFVKDNEKGNAEVRRQNDELKKDYST